MYKSRSEYWDWCLEQNDVEQMFLGGTETTFCKYVDVVNIETSAYCNRTCSYCPMSTIQREQEYIDDRLFSRIISQLKKMGYKNRVALNLYNEPLADAFLIDRIKEIKLHLPDCYIQLNSNGDLLSESKINELRASGLNQILVTLHQNPQSEYDDADRLIALKKFCKKIGHADYFDLKRIKPNENITIDVMEKDWRMLICCNNWENYGNDRGGTVKKLSKEGRCKPCVNPFREVCISYDGYFKPCCNIYFGKETNFGDLRKTDIIDCYFDSKMNEFRRHLFNFGEKTKWCYTCNTEDNAKINTVEKRKAIIGDLE